MYHHLKKTITAQFKHLAISRAISTLQHLDKVFESIFQQLLIRELEAKNTVFFVQDNGISIAPHNQQKIFDLFNKIDPKSEGTGSGLTLVKRIIEVHNGRIWLESAGLGQGTTFYFVLPG